MRPLPNGHCSVQRDERSIITSTSFQHGVLAAGPEHKGFPARLYVSYLILFYLSKEDVGGRVKHETSKIPDAQGVTKVDVKSGKFR